VEKNEVEAVKWYQKAATTGEHQGQYFLGLCYLEGTGVARSRETALMWLRMAALGGNTFATAKLKELGVSP
jgi:TPR repeat protein